jgi:hypothetical protein
VEIPSIADSLPKTAGKSLMRSVAKVSVTATALFSLSGGNDGDVVVVAPVTFVLLAKFSLSSGESAVCAAGGATTGLMGTGATI